MQDVKMQDMKIMKMTDQIATHKNARHEIAEHAVQSSTSLAPVAAGDCREVTSCFIRLYARFCSTWVPAADMSC